MKNGARWMVEMDRAAMNSLIEGKVQGVGFRIFVKHHAQRLGISGWVRNLQGGRTVELHAEGVPECLHSLIEQLHEGPAGARVERVEVEWIEPGCTSSEFQIIK